EESRCEELRIPTKKTGRLLKFGQTQRVALIRMMIRAMSPFHGGIALFLSCDEDLAGSEENRLLLSCGSCGGNLERLLMHLREMNSEILINTQLGVENTVTREDGNVPRVILSIMASGTAFCLMQNNQPYSKDM
ncbi:MAG: hypothetical protein HQL50_05330, partial [Magnetococcales bacterium]|nr:hypothetical protein [Magnetococcales bacterium]